MPRMANSNVNPAHREAGKKLQFMRVRILDLESSRGKAIMQSLAGNAMGSIGSELTSNDTEVVVDFRSGDAMRRFVTEVAIPQAGLEDQLVWLREEMKDVIAAHLRVLTGREDRSQLTARAAISSSVQT